MKPREGTDEFDSIYCRNPTMMTNTIHEKKYVKLCDIDGDTNPYSNSYI